MQGSRRTGALSRRAVLPLGGAVAVVALGVAAFFVFGASNPTKPKGPPTTTTTVTTAGTTTKSSGNTTFVDTADGFTVTYPKSWQRVSTDEAPFQADIPGTQDAMRVQVFQIGTAITSKSTVKQIEAVTDTVLASAPGRLIFDEAITVNKMPGYYYQDLYAKGSQEGTNSLYFLFQGKKMSILTFQALPKSDFAKLGPTFADIVASYTSNPAKLGPVPSTATTTATTAAHTATTTKKATATTTKKATATTTKK